MGMMDTSTKFEYHGVRKKLIIYKCHQCPKMVFYNGWGYYCNGISLPDENKRKISDPRKIPEWCPLKDA